MTKKSDNRILIENFAALTITQVISYVIPLISLPYLSRVLGAEKFGLVFWAQAMIQYFIIITDYGFGLSAVKEISINRNDKNKINQIFNSIMSIKFILILFCLIIMTVLVFSIPKFYHEWLLFYLTFFMVIGNAFYPIWFFQGIEHMKYITLLNVLAKSIFLILIFVFVKSPEDYILVAILNSLGFMIAGIIGIYIACKRFDLKIIIPSKIEIVHQFKYSSEFFLSRIAATGSTNTNSFIIGLITNPVSVAYYTAAEKIYYALVGLSVPISQVLYPYIAKNKNIKKFKKIFYPTVIILFLTTLFILINAEFFVKLFYGEGLIEAYKVLQIFCVTLLFSFVSAMVGYPLLAAMNHAKEANSSILMGVVFHICSLFILLTLNQLNIYKVAILTILTEGLILLYRVLAIKKYKLWSK